MRADRLVAVLLLLQTRGRVTAREVAAELEVSERTARRDLDALAMAGVPVFSQRGRRGGWELIGGARTDLTGLTATEARALFLVAGPASGATPEVKAALRKLVQALPEPFRHEAEAASNAVVVDPAGWDRPARERPPPPHLDALQQAVVTGECVRLDYVARDRATTRRIVHPLGLAAKGPVWYLVAGTDAGLRTFRVDRVRGVEPTGEPVDRPADFDLVEAWRLITDEVEQQRLAVWARGWADGDKVGLLRMMFGRAVRIGPAGPDGRVEVEIGSADARTLAGQVAGLGGSVEIVDPPAVRVALARVGDELRTLYGRSPAR